MSPGTCDIRAPRAAQQEATRQPSETEHGGGERSAAAEQQTAKCTRAVAQEAEPKSPGIGVSGAARVAEQGTARRPRKAHEAGERPRAEERWAAKTTHVQVSGGRRASGAQRRRSSGPCARAGGIASGGVPPVGRHSSVLRHR